MEELTVYDDDDDDDRQPMTYYRSRKVLGQLYRRIDDVQFLADVQRTGRGKPDVNKVLLGVWKYVSDETAGFLWDHLVPQVSDIQDMCVCPPRTSFCSFPYFLACHCSQPMKDLRGFPYPVSWAATMLILLLQV
jgi:hypothetical protein